MSDRYFFIFMVVQKQHRAIGTVRCLDMPLGKGHIMALKYLGTFVVYKTQSQSFSHTKKNPQKTLPFRFVFKFAWFYFCKTTKKRLHFLSLYLYQTKANTSNGRLSRLSKKTMAVVFDNAQSTAVSKLVPAGSPLLKHQGTL